MTTFTTETVFSERQLTILRRKFVRIERITPGSEDLKKLTHLLNVLGPYQLEQLAGAKIRFVSLMSHNRLTAKAELRSGLGLKSSV